MLTSAVGGNNVTVDLNATPQLDYHSLVDVLPDAVQEGLDNYTRENTAQDDCLVAPRWCLCEVPEGEQPISRMYKKLDTMLAYIGSLEGKDVHVWCFYGVPMRMTRPLLQKKSGMAVRYVLLPGEYEAVSVPKNSQLPSERGSATKMLGVKNVSDIDWQDDGFLGDVQLKKSVAADFYDRSVAASLAAKKKTKRDDNEGESEAEESDAKS